VLWNSRLVGVAYDGERPEVHFLDGDARVLFANLKRILPGTFPQVLDQTADGRLLLVLAQADRQPPMYLLVDRTTGKASVLAATYPGIEPGQLAAMNAITYTARDGARIPGYLTLPPGRAATHLPLIVMPHGGPIARDVWGFDFLQQFLVSRGYAVLQMEFRGSSGYGDAWYGAAHQDWGGLTYDDVIDGVRWAIERKVADPRRVAIVGWSFGGYVALLGAARDSELFRCAVSIAGVSDLKRLLGYASNFTNRLIVREQIGMDRDELMANSPRRLVDGVRIPVLMFHGTSDIQVPVDQGRLMSAALKRAGKPHELVEFDKESHQMDHEKNRTEMLRRIEAFLATHLGAEAVPAAVPAAAAAAGGG
jgi:dipeptidyl aminopeptidase/acylaminoacyl peptidase